MAESENGQDKTELPTPKKLQKMMESGQFARRMEIPTVLMVTAGLLVPQAKLAAKQVFPYFTFPMIDVPFNLTGHPTISVCAGFFGDEMPIGAQIAGRYFDEATVLRGAHGLERANGLRAQRPAGYASMVNPS